MHCVLEGVTKTLMSCWFSTTSHQKCYYLNRQVKDIDKCLRRIKPPYDIPRAPRSIETCLKFWKASEYRAWLLFYSIPVLEPFLPSDYTYHLALLVSTIHILLSVDISREDLKKCEKMLECFYNLIPVLYPREICTINVHSLIHLTDCVRRWGPLWCYSTFGFENLNGFLKKQCHATTNVLPQMIRSLHAHQSLPHLQRALERVENHRTMQFLLRIGSFKANLSTTISGPLGKIKLRDLSQQEKEVLFAAGLSIPSKISVFPRYKIERLVVHSKECSRKDSVRNNSVCIIHSDTGGPQFGSVETLRGVGGRHIAFVHLFEKNYEGTLSSLTPPRELSLRTNQSQINSVIYKVKKLSLSSQTIAVSVDKLLQKCVHVPIKYSRTDFIVTMPNTLEHHWLLFCISFLYCISILYFKSIIV